jgi:hypothetical protein
VEWDAGHTPAFYTLTFALQLRKITHALSQVSLEVLCPFHFVDLAAMLLAACIGLLTLVSEEDI